jgi:hypothetical protein
MNVWNERGEVVGRVNAYTMVEEAWELMRRGELEKVGDGWRAGDYLISDVTDGQDGVDLAMRMGIATE